MRATVARDEVARNTLTELVSSLFRGSPGEAIVYLLADEEIDNGELEEIRKKIEARKKGKSK